MLIDIYDKPGSKDAFNNEIKKDIFFTWSWGKSL